MEVIQLAISDVWIWPFTVCVSQKQFITTTFPPFDFFATPLCLILQSSLKTVEKHIVWNAAFLPAVWVYFDSCHSQCVNSKGVYSVKALSSFTTVSLSLFFDWKSEYFGSYLHFQHRAKWTLYTVDGNKNSKRSVLRICYSV